MNTDQSLKANFSEPVEKRTKEVTLEQMMNKLLELEKKIEVIEKKLTTPLIK